MLKLVIGNRNYSSWSLRAWLYLRESLQFIDDLVPVSGAPVTHGQVDGLPAGRCGWCGTGPSSRFVLPFATNGGR
jgi:hypothetical protein